MARADRRRSRSQAAAARPRSEYAAIEDQLFFSKLRSSAKIGFVFLALVFGVGFVAFGVGSEFGGGIADVIQGRSSSNEVSVEEARKRVAENPRDAEALRELAAALQREGRLDEAVQPLERYLTLNPRDETVLRELAAVYVGKATRLRNEAAQIQQEGQVLAPSTAFEPGTDTQLGQALTGGVIRDSLTSELQQRVTEKYIALQEAYSEAQRAYGRLARLEPQDAQVQLQLADSAVNAGNFQVALRAYKRFLVLAPDDPTAPLVREEIKRLEREAPAPGS